VPGAPSKLCLGGGVLVLGNAAVRKPSFILIDEPELSLHPSLQVEFLTRLGGYASEGTLFATHNIGLARAVADEIFSVTTATAGSRVSEFGATPRLAELMGELNYEGYRPLGFDKVLFVEGRTSVKLFIEFLRALKKDHEFLIMPLSDMITRYSREELQEVTKISPRVFVVIDSERDAAGASLDAGREEFARNCRDLGITCHVLERRAVENYLSDAAIKQTLGSAFRSL